MARTTSYTLFVIGLFFAGIFLFPMGIFFAAKGSKSGERTGIPMMLNTIGLIFQLLILLFFFG